jgi:hypothetical protein
MNVSGSRLMITLARATARRFMPSLRASADKDWCICRPKAGKFFVPAPKIALSKTEFNGVGGLRT